MIDRRPWVLSCLVSLSIVLMGCRDPQQHAIRALHDLNYDFTPDDFHTAAGRGDRAGVDAFLTAGMGVDVQSEDGATALIRAAETGRAGVAEFLLERGAESGLAGSNGRTPLLFAAQGGHFEVIRVLLREGVDPYAKDEDGWSALTLAAFKGHGRAVEVLAPRSMELLDDALLISAFEGDPEVIDLILNHGAYVNTRSPNHQTPLMIAAMNGHLDAVKVLLANGANRYALDREDASAADLAAANNHAEVSEHLNQPPEFGEKSEMVADVAEGFGLEGMDAVAVLEEFETFVPDGGGIIEAVAAVAEEIEKSSHGESLEPADWRPAGSSISSAGSMMARLPVRARKPRRLDSAEVIAGAAMDSRAMAEQFQMRSYREEHLPVVLRGVEEGAAEVRVLYGERSLVTVGEGEEISDTGLRVVRLERKHASSKQGKGGLVDVSQMVVEDMRSGERHLLVKDLPSKSSKTYAVMEMDASGTAYDVRAKDEFTAVGEDFADRYRVVDVRPTQVVIENLDTRDLHTIVRGGSRYAGAR